MEFSGMQPLADLETVAEIQVESTIYDLHNWGELRSIEIDYPASSLFVRWTVREPAVGVDGLKTIANVTLEFRQVTKLAVEGDPLSMEEDHELDFLFLQKDPRGVDHLSIEFTNDSRMVVCAEKCIATVTREAP